MSNPYPGDPGNPYSSNPGDPYQQSAYSSQPVYGQPAYGGQPIYGVPVQPVIVSAPQTSGKAIAALILGLCTLLFGIFAGIPAVILGHMALNEINNSGGLKGGKGMAITGLVFGYIFIGLGVCACFFLLINSGSPQP